MRGREGADEQAEGREGVDEQVEGREGVDEGAEEGEGIDEWMGERMGEVAAASASDLQRSVAEAQEQPGMVQLGISGL